MASLSDLGRLRQAADIFGLSATGEPQRNYMFECTVLGENVLDQFKFFVKSINIPSVSREPIMIDYMDEKLIYSGKDSSTHSFNMIFWDDQYLTIYTYLNEWMREQGSVDRKTAHAHPQYVKNMEVKFKDTSDTIITGTFEIKNMFPTEIGEIAATYESSDIVEIQATFAFDYVNYNNKRSASFDVLGGLIG